MLNFLLDNSSAKFPLKVASILKTTATTYAELSRQAQSLAASL
jgi:hypothetical protein